MLQEPMMEKLTAMRLLGMVEGLKAQEQDPASRELSFLERLGLPLLTESSIGWSTMLIESRCAAIPCARSVALSRRTDARRGFCVLRRGQGLPPLSPHPFLRYRRASFAALRMVFLDEAEHFLHNRDASVATLRRLFAFGPECRSRSLRNRRSPSPESSDALSLSTSAC